MEQAVRGLNPVWRLRCAGLVNIIALLATACVSRGTLSVPLDDEEVEAPAGCTETMCDYFFSRCMDPCSECWDACGRQTEILDVIHCSEGCTEVCARIEGKPVPAAGCADELATCRSTARNAVCVDRLRDDAPSGSPACSADMGRANCACGRDGVCLGTLERLNPACSTCNVEWGVPCLLTACKKENDNRAACLHSHGCGVAPCEACTSATEALATCFRNAQLDPSDTGGCYSGRRQCWQDPACPLEL
jgi:hypothetical protein